MKAPEARVSELEGGSLRRGQLVIASRILFSMVQKRNTRPEGNRYRPQSGPRDPAVSGKFDVGHEQRM